MSEDLFSQPFMIARQSRDATVVIRGYVYQVNMTLLKWIELEPDRRLELEAGEDIDALQQAVTNPNQPDRVLEAVKCREKNLTLRSPEALSALAAFQEHRQGNPSLRLGFRYITNSPVGAENPAVMELGTPGIHLWERIFDRSKEIFMVQSFKGHIFVSLFQYHSLNERFGPWKHSIQFRFEPFASIFF